MSNVEESLGPGEQPLPVDPKTGFPVGYGKAKEEQMPEPPPAYDAPPDSLKDKPRPPKERNVIDELGNSISEKAEQVAQTQEEVPNDMLYPRGTTQAMVDAWKAKYGENNVYLINICEKIWIFRAVTRMEWGKIRAMQLDSERLEEQIALTCLLAPKLSTDTLRAIPGGIAASMFEYVMRISGFGAPAIPIRL